MDSQLENVPPIPEKIKHPGSDLCSAFQLSCTGPYPRPQYQVRPPCVVPGRGRFHTFEGLQGCTNLNRCSSDEPAMSTEHCKWMCNKAGLSKDFFSVNPILTFDEGIQTF